MVINRIRVFLQGDSDRRFAWQEERAVKLLDLEDLFTDKTIRIRPSPTVRPVELTETRRSEPLKSKPGRKSGRVSRRRQRGVPRPSVRRRNWVLAVSIGIALLVGALVGSGAFDDRARFNADRYAAESGEVELYTVPGVYGHPGAEPRATQARSGSIREFLGMSSAF